MKAIAVRGHEFHDDAHKVRLEGGVPTAPTGAVRHQLLRRVLLATGHRQLGHSASTN